MAIQPQLFRAPLDPQGQARPFAELTLEQQVDLQGQQMLQLQQVIAMQQWQMAASADVQASLELQSVQLQALALETHEVANAHIANMQQVLTEKEQEREAQKAEIAMLKAQLAGQQAVHAAVKAAAEQTVDLQSKVISSQREEIAMLSKAFKKLEEVTNGVSSQNPYFYPLCSMFSSQHIMAIYGPAFAVLSSQVSETHKEQQQNIQSKTP